MATKTISLDLEAYARLRGAKGPNESFSEVIKRLVPPPFAVERWFAGIDANPMTTLAARSVEARVASRSKKARVDG